LSAVLLLHSSFCLSEYVGPVFMENLIIVREQQSEEPVDLVYTKS